MLSLGNKIALLKIIAHRARTKILEELAKGVKCISDIDEFLDMSQPNVSHHLSLLRRYCACCPVTKKGTYPEERRHC